MSNPVRFFLDEHMPEALAAALRVRGIDVLTVPDAGRLGFSDEDQLRFATADGRVVVTHDTDYLVLGADFQMRGEPFAGVAFCLARKYANDVGKMLRALEMLHAVYEATDLLDRVEHL